MVPSGPMFFRRLHGEPPRVGREFVFAVRIFKACCDSRLWQKPDKSGQQILEMIMLIEMRPLTSIRPYANNPRLNDDAVAPVAASIREFGWRQPIVVDTEGVIICGHTRYKAAQHLGLTEVPVHVATDLTPAQIRAYRIADNQSATLAEWNYDLLPLELGELQNMDFDLGLLGFGEDELAKILNPIVADGACDPDEVPEPPDAAITQPGDLWVLGNHRLLCGDSSSPVDLDR